MVLLSTKGLSDADLDRLFLGPGRSGHEREHGCGGNACPDHCVSSLRLARF
jgi:hypothetical protein